jgi:uncharacterized protein YjbJ (UPF0337 family)
MSDKNTSTLQSYMDSASGAVQSVIGNITGNTSDQVCPSLFPQCFTEQLANTLQTAGEAKQDKAALEHDASHAAAKVGPLSASSSGAVTKDDPNRTEGSWNQTVGSAKETVGGLVGSEVRCTIPSYPPSYSLPPSSQTPTSYISVLTLAQ